MVTLTLKVTYTQQEIYLADGNITLGDADTDSIFINADIASDIMSDVDNTYDIGKEGKRWATGRFANVTTNTLTTNDLDFGSIRFDSYSENNLCCY